MTDTSGFAKVSNDGGLFSVMAQEVEALNKNKGWYDESRTFGDEVALLHSEVSEMLEAFRDHGTEAYRRYTSPTGGYSVLPANDPNVQRWEANGEFGKPEGVSSEAADVLVRLLDTCKRYDIDLFAEWRRKMNFNWQRPKIVVERAHGGKKL